MASPRTIVHLDADAFYASVEQATNPRLRGTIMAVGGQTRGIIASASYEARKLGVYTPMPTAQALKICPALIMVRGDFEKYELFSRWMFSYVQDFTPEIEATGIDEGYFDLSQAKQSALEIVQKIRQAIERNLKITVSFGIGTNRLVSQIASKLNKPRGLHQIPAGSEREFLDPLPGKWLPGIGPKAAARLDGAGLKTIRDVAEASPSLLEELMGSYATELRQYAHGIDGRSIDTGDSEAKSFGEQETFDTNLTDREHVEAVLRRMADSLMLKVREAGKAVRTITVKARYRHMDEEQRSESLPEPTDLEAEVYPRLRPLLDRAWKRGEGLRLVGLRLSNVHENLRQEELPLFGTAASSTAQRALAHVVDDLRRSFGHDAIMRGHDLRLRHKPE
jgi:nucleotidyltransferase/DNA polymerase involved in DNA repair